jgi:gamma-carbonic anhydrase
MSTRGNVFALGDLVPRLAADAYIAPGSQIIGDVTIEAGASIWFNCVLRGDGNSIHVGAGSNVQDGTVVHITTKLHGTWIGANVLVGHQALIHGCRLEDWSFVGFAAQVMDGCVVETDAMLAAGALLPPGKRVPGGQLWAGRPAKYMRDLTEDDIRRNRAGVIGYQQLAQTFLRDLRQV